MHKHKHTTQLHSLITILYYSLIESLEYMCAFSLFSYHITLKQNKQKNKHIIAKLQTLPLSKCVNWLSIKCKLCEIQKKKNQEH